MMRSHEIRMGQRKNIGREGNQVCFLSHAVSLLLFPEKFLVVIFLHLLFTSRYIARINVNCSCKV